MRIRGNKNKNTNEMSTENAELHKYQNLRTILDSAPNTNMLGFRKEKYEHGKVYTKFSTYVLNLV